MSKPDEAHKSPKLDTVQLLIDLGACLVEWSRAQARGARAEDPDMARLRTLTAELQPRFGVVGFGGIAFRLGELLFRLDSEGRVGDFRQPLAALADLSEQARSSLTPAEHDRLVRLCSPPREQPARAPGGAGPTPPPMLTIARALGVAGGHGVPETPPLSLKPPPLLGTHEPVGAPAPFLPGFQSAGDGLLSPQHARSGPVLAPPGTAPKANAAAVPSIALPPLGSLGSVSLPQAGVPSHAHAFNQLDPIAPSRPSGESIGVLRAPSSPSGPAQPAAGVKGRPANAPNLQVRTMFGLRAFGARKPRSDTNSHQAQAPAQAEHSGSLLDLKRRSSSLAGPLATPPPLLDRPFAGLPALPPPADLPAHDERLSRAPGQGPRGASGPQILSDIARFRVGRRGERAGAGPAMLRYRQQESSGWRVGAIALALLALVLGGLTTLVVVLTRSSTEAEREQSRPAVSQTATQKPVSSADLPQSRLLTESESFRTLLTQVHGRGNESAELRVLVDEEAALIAGGLSQRECKGAPAACKAWAKMHQSILGPQGAKHITRHRSAGSLDRVGSRWLVGLKLPEIPIEDDPRVQRSLEFYTENPVGRATFQEMLFRCGAYRDLIQATLIRYGLPVDLWSIVFVESGCTPQATSPVGAAGLWQFMPATARAYHLRVKDDVIDERRSPPKSTEAAVRYLRDLRDKLIVYNEAGVWDLVFGSYNMGSFGMVARIERAGGEGVGFWDLVDADLLPDETAQYSPAVQAVALILNNLQRLRFSAVQMRAPQLTSDLQVPPGTRLSLVARAAATSVNDLRALNLDIRGDTTPDVANFAIQVPKDVVWQARDTLKELTASRDQLDQCVPPTFNWGRQRFNAAMETACRRKLGAGPVTRSSARP